VPAATFFRRIVEAPRDVMVDCVRWDRQRGEDARDRHRGQEPEDHDGPERIGGDAGNGGGHGIAGMVEGFVAAGAAGKGARVLIVSSSADEGAAVTVQALALGAADTLVKPGIGTFGGRFAEVLEERLSRLVEVHFDSSPVPNPTTSFGPVGTPADFDIVAIGASTGGIHALSQFLRAIPSSFQVPILVTQHLPMSFMGYFAAQLAVLGSRPCEVASDRMRIRPGRIIVAPGNAHMRVAKMSDGWSVRLNDEKSLSGCMPSVDPMFESLAEVFGKRALAVVLSGMGRDGAEGAKRLVEAGAKILVQDRASSVIWGMPGAVANAGHASAVLPPDEIGRLVAWQGRA